MKIWYLLTLLDCPQWHKKLTSRWKNQPCTCMWHIKKITLSNKSGRNSITRASNCPDLVRVLSIFFSEKQLFCNSNFKNKPSCGKQKCNQTLNESNLLNGKIFNLFPSPDFINDNRFKLYNTRELKEWAKLLRFINRFKILHPVGVTMINYTDSLCLCGSRSISSKVHIQTGACYLVSIYNQSLIIINNPIKKWINDLVTAEWVLVYLLCNL